MKAHIIYRNYLNASGTEMSVGGIQTYITNLSVLLRNRGYYVSIYQKANNDFKIEYEGCTINGFAFEGRERELPQFLYGKCRPTINLESDILIFGCETFAVKNDVPRTIGIQHGISWDKPNRTGCSKVLYFLDYAYQAYKSWLTIKRVSNVNKLVCVDYNFVNWYRALVAYPGTETIVIPNFTPIPAKTEYKHNSDTINIIFARRFFIYRGTRIFTKAIKQILQDYNNIHVYIAGEGPDEKYLHDELDKFSNISFLKYKSQDSLSVHRDKHIAVIPTLGSEGTSLSLLEAMASQCAVICTNVGGMVNVVIDHYNGIVISPNEDELYHSLIELIENRDLRIFTSEKAYDTVAQAFSLDRWSDKWKKLISDLY